MMSDSESGSGSARVVLLTDVLAVAECIGPGLPILGLDVVGCELLSVVFLDGDMPEPWPEMLVPARYLHPSAMRRIYLHAKPLLILIQMQEKHLNIVLSKIVQQWGLFIPFPAAFPVLSLDQH